MAMQLTHSQPLLPTDQSRVGALYNLLLRSRILILLCTLNANVAVIDWSVLCEPALNTKSELHLNYIVSQVLRSSAFEGMLLKATWPGNEAVPQSLLDEIIKHSIPAFKYGRAVS